jgi:hypothetical protein
MAKVCRNQEFVILMGTHQLRWQAVHRLQCEAANPEAPLSVHQDYRRFGV